MSSLAILGGGKKTKKEYGAKAQKQFMLQVSSTVIVLLWLFFNQFNQALLNI